MPLWPRLSEIYGLHPGDEEGMSAAQINAYLDDLVDKAEQARQQE